MATIYNYSFHFNNPEEHKYISDDTQHIASTLISQYIDGESFLLGQETQDVL